MNSRELMKALQLIEKQRGIDREEIFQAIENSLISACKKNFGTSQNIKVDMNRETGEVTVYAQKEVTEDVYDGFLEISLEEAKEINPNYEYGDIVDIQVTPRDFGRISAQAAKQVVVQKFREAEREKLYNEFVVKQNDNELYVKKLETLMSNDDKLKSFSDNCKEYSNNFLVSNIIDDWLELLKKIDKENL